MVELNVNTENQDARTTERPPQLLILGTGITQAAQESLSAGFHGIYYELPHAGENMRAYLKALNAQLKQSVPILNTVVVVVPMAPQGHEEQVDLQWVEETFGRTILVLQRLSQNLMSSKTPSQIIFVQFAMGESGHPNLITSSTLSGANIGLVKCLAKELGRYAVSANVIGVSDCDELNISFDMDDAYQKLFDLSGLGNNANVEKINSAMHHLVMSEMSVTGQVLRMDGGILM